MQGVINTVVIAVRSVHIIPWIYNYVHLKQEVTPLQTSKASRINQRDFKF